MHRGFTFIELITVMLVLGIISVFVVPRVMNKGGFTEATYQARLVSALRNMQMRAMQDSRDGFCFHILLNANGTSDPAFGAPTLDYSGSSDTCATTIDYSLADNQSTSYTTQAEMDNEGLSLSAQDNGANISSIGFNGLGQPINEANNSAGMCTAGPCVLSISGESTRYVCIAQQGYIFASTTSACTSS